MTSRPFAWESQYPDSVSWDADIEISTLPHVFERAVELYGDRIALDYRATRLTYADLGGRVARAAAAFRRAGIGPGTTLALYLNNTAHFPIVFFAGIRTGARLVLLSPLDAERELAHKLNDSGARLLVTSDLASLLPKAMGLIDGGRVDRLVVVPEAVWGDPAPEVLPLPERADVTGWEDFVAGVEAPPAWPEIRPADIALLQYTGGTTGRPKGAILTHGNLTASAGIYDVWLASQRIDPDARERVLCMLPLFHIYALTTILIRHLKNGNEILLRARFDAAAILNDIETLYPTTFPGVPTMWIALANFPGIETRDLSSLTHCSSGGASLPVDVANRFHALTGLTLLGGWGMTETAPAGTNLPRNGPDKPGSIGIPLPRIEMGIVALDDPHRALGVGETGELRVKGPNVTPGYWNREEESAAAFADGYFLTGDVGFMDADGYFYIIDRKKDMILSGGFNVYPQVVEQAIFEHPGVAEVLVVGVPDAYRGESAKAFVVLRAGHEPFTLEDLQAFLADKVGRHEMPRDLEFRDALPRTGVGKYSKLQLRQEEIARRAETAAATAQGTNS